MGYYRDLMDREMRIRGFADSTRDAYLGCVRRFVGYYMTPPDALALGSSLEQNLRGMSDGLEGLRAFAEKRRPNFKDE